MTGWLAVTLMLLLAMFVPILMAATGPLRRRLAAVQLLGAVGTPLLIAMTFALQAPSAVDLALMLGLLTLPAVLLFAIFVERWL